VAACLLTDKQGGGVHIAVLMAIGHVAKPKPSVSGGGFLFLSGGVGGWGAPPQAAMRSGRGGGAKRPAVIYLIDHFPT